MGQSAGGASISYHLISPMSKGMRHESRKFFHKSIAFLIITAF